MAAVISKENLSAYERWELDCFDSAPGHGTLALTTAEQVEGIHQLAREEGFAAGYREGAARAAAESARLAALACAFEQASEGFEERLAGELIDLALELGRQMLAQALKVRPELLLPVVREAIRQLPSQGDSRRLLVHPEDAALLRAQAQDLLARGGWHVTENTAIGRGGCRIETSHGQIDATLEARWQRTLAEIGRDDRWLATEDETRRDSDGNNKRD